MCEYNPYLEEGSPIQQPSCGAHSAGIKYSGAGGLTQRAAAASEEAPAAAAAAGATAPAAGAQAATGDVAAAAEARTPSIVSSAP